MKMTKKQYKKLYISLEKEVIYDVMYRNHKPFYLPLTSMNYIPATCEFCGKNTEIINSHSISSGWVIHSKSEQEIFTLTTDYSKFPLINDKLDILSIFFKNSENNNNNKNFTLGKNFYKSNFKKYFALNFHKHLNYNIFIKHDDIFKYYIFSTYKNCCSNCDCTIFNNLDNISNVYQFLDNDIFTLLIKRFSDFFDYRFKNYDYTLENYIKNLLSENISLKSKKDIDVLKIYLDKNIANIPNNKNYEHSFLHSNKIYNEISQCNNVIKNDISFNMINRVLHNIKKSLTNNDEFYIPKNEIKEDIIKSNSKIKKQYFEIWQINKKYNNYNLLSFLDREEYKVIYEWDICNKNTLFGFCYFNTNNMLSKLDMNIDKSLPIGFCWLTPVFNEKKKFIVYGTKKIEDDVDKVINKILILQTYFDINFLKKIIFSFVFLHDSYNMNVYSLNDVDLNKHIDFINKNWHDKQNISQEDMIYIIKYFSKNYL